MNSKPTSKYTVGVIELCLVLLAAPAAQAGSNRWTPLGPLGRNVSIVVVDPETPTTLYAGTYNGGVFKSTDAGASWLPSSDGIPHGFVKDLVIDPETPSRLYAATLHGAYRSTDGAATWSKIRGGLPLGREVFAMALEPGHPAVVWAATGFRGLFKSTDYGDNWVEQPLDILQSAYDIAFDPLTPSTVYASAAFGIYKSTDGGATWTQISEGISSPDRFRRLVLDPQTPTTLYAIHSWSGRLFKSTDGGTSWLKKSFNGGKTLEVDPWDTSILFSGTPDGIWTSADGGESWSQVGGGLPATNGRVNFDPASSEILHAATDAGVYRSTDQGETWSPANDGILNVPILALAVDPRDPSTLYASVDSEERLLRSVDRGATWAPVVQSLNPSVFPNVSFVVLSILVDPVTPATLYVVIEASRGDVRERIFKSTDGGASWSELSSDLLLDRRVFALALDPVTPTNLYALASGDLLGSRDGGESWELLSRRERSFSRFLKIDPRTPTHLYSLYNRSVIKSVDGGRTWSEHSLAELVESSLDDLAIDPATSTTLYVSTRTGQVYKSVDGARSWRKASVGLPAHNWRDVPLAVDPRNPAHLYLGGPLGVFRSRDGGRTWSPFSEGLTHPEARHLALAAEDPPTVYVGTPGGVFAAEVVDEDTDVLELHGGRFRIEVDWRDFTGQTGRGRPVRFSGEAASGDSGIFYFFSADNWELLIKVLDGCAVNDRFWVFAAATTNVEYVLTVTDTAAGAVKTYTNPLGVSAAALTDTGAFATCGE